MAYENIRLRKKNSVIINGYFYMMDDDTDSLVVKTDDGTHAFSYPLDSTINNQVLSLEYDGRNFWSLEDTGDDYVIIRRWYIDNYVCKLRSTFDSTAWGTNHKCASRAFTVEHYHINFASDEPANENNISISDGSKLVSGMTIVLGPNRYGQMEEFDISSSGADHVIINGRTSYDYEAGDPICFYTTIWLFNDYNGTDETNGALYKINPYTGSFMSKTAGGAYTDVDACTFYDVSEVHSGWGNAICYIKASNMIFLNPNDLNDSYGSMSLDNIEKDQSTIIPIYDVTIDGSNVYRIQKKATYKETTHSWTTYNYQLSTLHSFINSISLRADPAIIPANGVNVSTITAVVKDQFNHPVTNKLVYFDDDDDDGYMFSSDPDNDTGIVYKNTDGNGVAVVGYKSGITAREVIITATAQQG